MKTGNELINGLLGAIAPHDNGIHALSLAYAALNADDDLARILQAAIRAYTEQQSITLVDACNFNEKELEDLGNDLGEQSVAIMGRLSENLECSIPEAVTSGSLIAYALVISRYGPHGDGALKNIEALAA